MVEAEAEAVVEVVDADVDAAEEEAVVAVAEEDVHKSGPQSPVLDVW